MSDSFGRFLRAGLERVRAADRFRRRRVITGGHGVDVLADGRRCVNFCSNDYLGLATHPALTQAMTAAAGRCGSGGGASQLITGYNAEHAALEEELADFVGRERALLFATGYATNMGVIEALVGRGDHLVADALNHASLIDGARLSGAAKHIYAHADAGAAATALSACPAGHRLLVSDAVFSMDGDIAPLAGLAQAAHEHDAWLMLDDAHGFGILGNGRGTPYEPTPPVPSPQSPVPIAPIYIATLGKALGAAGGFVAGSADLIEYLIQRARTFIFSTAPPPPVAAAARAGLQLARTEHWRREHLFALIRRFQSGARQLGLRVGPPRAARRTPHAVTPIQPLILGDEARALAVSDALLERGYLVSAIRPPTVPAGSSRLRITLSAAHSEDHVDGLHEALAAVVPAAAHAPSRAHERSLR